MGELTEAEREAWDVDPDKWPHTPPLPVFRALMAEDDNTWWRAGSGHGLNAYEAAIERVEEMEARAETLARQVVAVEALAERWKRSERWLDASSNTLRARAETNCADADALRAALTDPDGGDA